MRKSLKRLFFFNTCVNTSFVDPILIMFFIANDLSFTEIMLLTTIAYVVVFLTEIPSGFFADLVGDRKIILFGLALNMISVTIFVSSSNFIGFIFGSIFSALSSSCISGADESFSYRLLKDNNIDFESYISKVKSYSFYIMGVASVIGGFVYSINQSLPLYLNFVLYVVLFVSVLGMKIKKYDDSPDGKQNVKIVKAMISLQGNRRLQYVLVIALLIGALTFVGKNLSQPLMNIKGIDVSYFGIIYFIFSIVAGYGSSLYMRLKKILDDKIEFFIFSSFMLTFMGMYLLNGYFTLISLLMFNALRGLAGPYLSVEINKYVEEKFRTTFLSARSFLIGVTIAITSPILGLLMDSIGLIKTVLAVSGVTLLVIVILLIYKKLGK